MKRNKLGIIVPYRDRYEHLGKFKESIVHYLDGTDINYEIIIVEQDNAKLFNRGMILNIGFTYAKKLGCNYVIFHDVDMLPVNVDYSYSNVPLHLATHFISAENTQRIVFDEYFGGVTLFPVEDFIKINGFSNKYWGWGYEDTDLLLRCKKNEITLDTKIIKQKYIDLHALRFNGVDSYVKCKNIFNLNSDMTIFVSFTPDELTCNHLKDSDDFTILSIPGYDTSITYNSFSRYNFCTFDSDDNALYVNSNIKTNYKTNICVTIDSTNKIIKVFQDGEKIGEIINFKQLRDYSNEKYFYLGAGDPNRKGNEKFFKGVIEQLFVYSEVLDEEFVKIFSKDSTGMEFTEYTSTHDMPENLEIYYTSNVIKDYKLYNFADKGNDGEIVNCEKIWANGDDYKEVKVPLRRESTFNLLYHEENGFHENKWKTQFTRWNQLRFYNEVSKNDDLLKNDGLSDLSFVEHGKIKNGKITQVIVGI